MLKNFLKLVFWTIPFNRYVVIVGCFIIVAGVVTIISIQSGQQSTPARVYKLPSKPRTYANEQQTPRSNTADMAAHKTADYNSKFVDETSSMNSDFETDQVVTENSETAANSMDSTVQKGWGHYDPPPPDPEQERIWKMEERVQELLAEIQALSPEVEKDIKLLPRLNKLIAEHLSLQKKLGRLSVEGLDPLVGLELQNFVVAHMTAQGMPVSAGPRMAEIVEKMGDIEGAKNIRAATKKAMENGDEFFQAEHVESSEEY